MSSTLARFRTVISVLLALAGTAGAGGDEITFVGAGVASVLADAGSGVTSSATIGFGISTGLAISVGTAFFRSNALLTPVHFTGWAQESLRGTGRKVASVRRRITPCQSCLDSSLSRLAYNAPFRPKFPFQLIEYWFLRILSLLGWCKLIWGRGCPICLTAHDWRSLARNFLYMLTSTTHCYNGKYSNSSNQVRVTSAMN